MRHTTRVAALFAALPLIAPASLAAQDAVQDAAPSSRTLAGFEDYRQGIGRIGDDGVLRAALVLQAADWRPWGSDGPAIRTHVYAVDGAAPRTPGPLIRVKVGTPVQLDVHNELGDPIVLRGLRDRGAIPATAPPAAAIISDSVSVAPGASAEVRFTPTVPGTFLYFARTVPVGQSAPLPTLLPVRSADRSLWGVLVVDPEDYDPATAPREEIFLLTHWADPSLPGTFLPATRFFVNGRSWPHTRRLEYAQGDTVRWRVLNATGRPHPMHLHGAYFTVDARGDQLREAEYPAAERRLGVTETLDITQSMRLSWIAHEPGNWLFHCHFMRHMSWLQTSAPGAPPDRHAPHEAQGEALMGGLVVGITVQPRPDAVARAEPARRRLDLHATRREGVFGDEPGYAFVLAERGTQPARDSLRFPGSLLLIERGEPTEIVVHNHTDVALGVHWHGLELESRSDGVPGWSGDARATVPAIPPGDTLRVRMAPPRAGTFMYHVHSEPGHQLGQGLYGPLLVLEPGTTWNADTDHLFLLGSLGAGDDPPAAINGEHEPQPRQLRSGVAHRLRFMHISPDDDKRVTLLQGDRPVEWRLVARDGADLPAAHQRSAPAQLRIDVGQTFDVLWTPEPGEYVLRVVTTFDQGVAAFRREAPPPHTAEVRIMVR